MPTCVKHCENHCQIGARGNISTDIITGFVGETEEDFQATLELVEKIRFDSAFMFSYSPREGTPAWGEKETLTEAEKQKRLEELIAKQLKITEESLDSMIGRKEEILIEGPSPKNQEEMIGKTGCFKKVVLPADSRVCAGDLVEVQVTERRGQTLRGRVFFQPERPEKMKQKWEFPNQSLSKAGIK